MSDRRRHFFGDGRSSLRLWPEIQPDIVKIDTHITHDLPADAEKLQTFGEQLARSVTLARIEAARHGDMRFHPCTTLSIGTVRIAPGNLHRPEQVASAAATAKRHAKRERLNAYVMAV